MTAAKVILPDGRTFCLGMVSPKSPPQVLRFKMYRTLLATTPPPAVVNYGQKAASSLARMYLNDREGCCVISGETHQIGVVTGNDSPVCVVATDAEIQQMYNLLKAGPGDSGCIITDVLNYKKSHGMLAAGKAHKIDGYVAVDLTNRVEVQVATYLFGGITLGLNLPGAWSSSARPGFTWDNTNSPPVGGHEIVAYGYNGIGVLVSTWGMTGTVTWAALANTSIFTEGYAQLSPEWYGSDKLAPCGVDASTLAADLAKLGGGVIPPIPDPNPTPPDPVPPAPVPDLKFPLTISVQANGRAIVTGSP